MLHSQVVSLRQSCAGGAQGNHLMASSALNTMRWVCSQDELAEGSLGTKQDSSTYAMVYEPVLAGVRIAAAMPAYAAGIRKAGKYVGMFPFLA